LVPCGIRPQRIRANAARLARIEMLGGSKSRGVVKKGAHTPPEIAVITRHRTFGNTAARKKAAT